MIRKKEISRLKPNVTDDVQSAIEYVYDERFEDETFVQSLKKKHVDSENSGYLELPETIISSDEFRLPNKPLLSNEQESELFLCMNLFRHLASNAETGSAMRDEFLAASERLRDHIVTANQRLVVSMASKFQKQGVTLDDLISEANLSILNAVGKFDVSRGFRFSTYASHAILRRLSRLVKRERKRSAHGLEDASAALSYEDGFPEWLDIHPGDLTKEILAELPTRQRRIVKERFGFTADGKSKTLREIGERMGISKERVRQLILSACQRARIYTGKRLGLAEM